MSLAHDVMPEGTTAAPQVAFVIAGPRSGTTLLRHLLDSHAAIACPAETGLPVMIETLSRVWGSLFPGVPGGSSQETAAGARIAEHALQAVREAATAPMELHLRAQGKAVYCDKSLDTMDRFATIRMVFPNARYLYLYRHPMDTIASALEASPWGFDGHGFTPYIQRSPWNFVAALAEHWDTTVGRMLACEQTTRGSSMRLTYEGLVSRPEEVIVGALRLLGVDSDPGTIDWTLSGSKRDRGDTWGDYKIRWTDSVHRDSVGRGRRIPVSMIPNNVLESINDKLYALGYEELDASWNRLREDEAMKVDVDTNWPAAFEQMLAERVAERSGASLPPFILALEEHHDWRWRVDPSSGSISRGGAEGYALVGGTTDFEAVLAGTDNFGVLLRYGRLRWVPADAATQTSTPEASGASYAETMMLVHDLLRPRTR